MRLNRPYDELGASALTDALWGHFGPHNGTPLTRQEGGGGGEGGGT